MASLASGSIWPITAWARTTKNLRTEAMTSLVSCLRGQARHPPTANRPLIEVGVGVLASIFHLVEGPKPQCFLFLALVLLLLLFFFFAAAACRAWFWAVWRPQIFNATISANHTSRETRAGGRLNYLIPPRLTRRAMIQWKNA